MEVNRWNLIVRVLDILTERRLGEALLELLKALQELGPQAGLNL